MIFDSVLSGTSAPSRWFFDALGGTRTLTGETINENTALNYSAVWAATRIIAETVASLPLITYRRLPGGRGKERAPDHNLYRVLHDAPNTEMDAFTFREMMTAFLVNWGNAYAEITRTPDGTIRELWPLHARQVRPIRTTAGAVAYEVSDDTGQIITIGSQNMLHLVGTLSENGITGKGVIRQARESIGMGVATEKYGAAFFGNGARPGGVLQHPGNPTKEAADAMRKGWESMHGGGAENAHRTALLREGTTYQAIGVPPEEAQFLESRQHNVTEIARWYRLPPHILADLSRATFTNIESENLNLVTHSIRPWLVRYEAAIRRQLLVDDDEHFAEFLIDGLLRGDTGARTTALTAQFLNGALTLNEWREIENRNALDGDDGDKHFVPLNLTPIEKITADEPEPGEEEGEEEEGGDPKLSGQPNQKAVDAAWVAAANTVYQMQCVEGNAIRRAAKVPEKFLGKVDSFYSKHETHFREAVRPPLVAWLAVTNDTRDPDAVLSLLAARHIAAARESILAACECPADELADRIDTLTKTWKPSLQGIDKCH